METVSPRVSAGDERASHLGGDGDIPSRSVRLAALFPTSLHSGLTQEALGGRAGDKVTFDRLSSQMTGSSGVCPGFSELIHIGKLYSPEAWTFPYGPALSTWTSLPAGGLPACYFSFLPPLPHLSFPSI